MPVTPEELAKRIDEYNIFAEDPSPLPKLQQPQIANGTYGLIQPLFCVGYIVNSFSRNLPLLRAPVLGSKRKFLDAQLSMPW
jgi:hypothetical protein